MSQSLQGITLVHTYTYNALGQRAEDIPVAQPGNTQEFLYDPSGQVLGNLFAYPPQPGWWHITVPALGRTLVNVEQWYIGAAWINHPNALGSALVATLENGTVAQDTQVYPWGQIWQTNGEWATGIYAGLLSFQCQLAPCPDQSQSRDYPPTLGRWLSPDPEGGDVTNPQSLNRYAYVLNNPTSLTDVLGLDHANCSNPAIAAKDPTCQEGPGASSSDVNSDEFGLLNLAFNPPTGFIPVSIGAEPDCPGCYYSTEGPFTDATWEPNNLPIFQLWGITWTQTSPTTWTLGSQLTFNQTVNTLKQAGFVEHPEDYIDFFHPNQLDLRDTSSWCSAHLDVDKASGQNGQPTTGDVHLDTANPWAQDAIFGPTIALVHAALDMTHLYPGSAACGP